MNATEPPVPSKPKIVLKLMADHDCHPLWRPRALGVENVDPGTLRISPALLERLRAWSREYDATIDQEDPRHSDFESQEQAVAFVREGAALRDELERELGDRFRILYHREAEGLVPEEAAEWKAAGPRVAAGRDEMWSRSASMRVSPKQGEHGVG